MENVNPISDKVIEDLIRKNEAVLCDDEALLKEQKEIEELMAKRTKIDMLWRIYKELIDYYLVGNSDLKKVIFHSMLGAYFTQNNFCYIESGEEKSTRIHLFIIQASGTGKSVAFKFTNMLLEHLDIKVRYTLRDNESAMTGTVFMSNTGKKRKRKSKDSEDSDDSENISGDKIYRKKGLLSKLSCWITDEGSVLLKGAQHSECMTDYLQMAMDEPGVIHKGMSLGTVDYKVNTTIITGSYMFDEFKTTIMEKGFLQRMFVLFVELSNKEEKGIRIGKNLLKLVVDTSRIERLKDEFKKLLDEILENSKKQLSFNPKDTMRFNVYLESMYNEYIENQYSGEKQDGLKTFFNRVHVTIDKIATQRAIINGHNEVRYDDMIYGAKLAKIHLSSVQRVFERIKITTKSNPVEIRYKTILDIINKKLINRVRMSILLSELQTHYSKRKWDLKTERTKALLDDMHKKGMIRIFALDDNDKMVCIS